MVSKALKLLAAIILITLWAVPASGQVERYELGQRVRRFETAWEKADAAARARAVEPLQAAVQSFFSFQLRKAGQQLDQAYFDVSLDAPPSDFRRWATSLRVDLAPAVADANQRELSIKLESFYDAGVKAQPEAKVELRLRDARGEELDKLSLTGKDVFDEGAKWTPNRLSVGRFTLDVRVSSSDGAEALELLPRPVERIENLADRVKTVEARRNEQRDGLSPTIAATWKNLMTILRPASLDQLMETDYPVTHLIEFAEALAADGDKNSVISTFAQRGDLWLALAEGKEQTVVRVRAPGMTKDAQATAGPLPVLFLFHGAGGSENMYFETYGAGRAVELGSARGWLVVAPRQSLLSPVMDAEKMLDQLDDYFELDRSRVFYVGHSMGAAQVMRQMQRGPSVPRAVAAVGGGGAIRDATAVAKVPWYVAAGSADFGRAGAKALAESLKRAGGQVTHKEFVDVEHLVIVQAALDEMFAFFDKTLVRP